MKGTVVDSKYQIVSCLGQGGMGAVYEARHLGTGRRVALKMIVPAALAARDDIIPRFRREARASGSIDSEHVVQVLDTGVDPVTSSPYLVMEYLSGQDLQQLVQRVGPLAPDTVLRVAAQACAGLSRAHEQGIIHRDIKAANIFVSYREGGEVTIKILDFGIAKVRADPLASSSNHSITRTGSLLGSPLYMSPEQVLGSKQVDPRADVYSLGITMYEALAGFAPNYDCETVGLLVIAITSGKIPPLQDRAPWVPPEVAAIVHKALALDPRARFQSAAEMHAAISALLPQGLTIKDAMLRGVTPETKSVVSSRLVHMTAPLLTPVPPLPAPGVAATSTAFTDSAAAGVPKRPAWLLALPVLLLLLGGGAVVGIYTHRSDHSAAAGSSAASSLSAPPSAAPEASATPSASAATSTAKPEVDAAIASAAASTTTTLLPMVPPPVDTVAAPRPRPVVMSATGVAPVVTTAAPTARPNCDPPYTFNADGKKIWKRECL